MTPNATMETITFECDQRKIFADIHPAEGEWACLLIHGWTGYRGGSAGALAQNLKEAGAMSLCVDLPGHGDSDGNRNKISKDEFLRAARAAYDRLVSLPEAQGRKILIVGTSFGGYMAARLVGQVHADAVALRVPANYEPFSEAVEAIKDFEGRVLVLEAENDDVIPPEMVQSYRHAVSDPARLTYTLLEGAPHSMSTVPEALAEANRRLAAWLA